ncbi:hypothetical protein OF820_10270 [Oceanotoga sp. DSM 15011]|uniref:hypothetical protein n=1 Tax=Oceanotoga TaxID=1255275 RepID=UPI0021F3E0C9|nr:MULTISPECIES: hypothetical protein [Oceanotoga]MDO7977514.1 hypothetical protein [Oceanotoga teriensis]UYO99452.1 hypothetical protein OF820_10270 [Oceanotoga sp. DSM 15011]
MKKLLIPLIVLLILLVGCTKTPTNGQDMSGLRIQVSNDFISDGEMGVPVNREISWNSTEVDKYQVMLKEGNETFKIIEETKAKTYALELKEATKYQLKIIALKDDKKVETDTVEFFTEGTFTAVEETEINQKLSEAGLNNIKHPYFFENKMFFINAYQKWKVYYMEKENDIWSSPKEIVLDNFSNNIASPKLIKNGDNYYLYVLYNDGPGANYGIFKFVMNIDGDFSKDFKLIGKDNVLSPEKMATSIWLDDEESQIYIATINYPNLNVNTGFSRSIFYSNKKSENWDTPCLVEGLHEVLKETKTIGKKSIRYVFKDKNRLFIDDDEKISVAFKNRDSFKALNLKFKVKNTELSGSYFSPVRFGNKLLFVNNGKLYSSEIF